MLSSLFACYSVKSEDGTRPSVFVIDVDQINTTDLSIFEVVIMLDFVSTVDKYSNVLTRMARYTVNGVLHSFLTEENAVLAGPLIEILQRYKQVITKTLRNMSLTSSMMELWSSNSFHHNFFLPLIMIDATEWNTEGTGISCSFPSIFVSIIFIVENRELNDDDVYDRFSKCEKIVWFVCKRNDKEAQFCWLILYGIIGSQKLISWIILSSFIRFKLLVLWHINGIESSVLIF